MKDDTLAHLHDLLQAGRDVKTFVDDRTFDDYKADSLLRSAVERKFEIMGEALTRIRRDDPDILARIRESRDIISFRVLPGFACDFFNDGVVSKLCRELCRELCRCEILVLIVILILIVIEPV